MNNIVKRLMENRQMVEHMQTPDQMYKEYLTKHVDGVKRVYENILKPILVEEGVSEGILAEIDRLIADHDRSKYSYEEWGPYRDHFYDPEKNPKSGSIAYDYAWNHHQKCNPHHWQYWVLCNDVDDPQHQALEMPLEYIIELLCDWQSAGAHYGNTANDWYTKQSDRMILHPKTRETIEKYIEYLK